MEHGSLDPEDKGQRVKCLSCGSPNEGFFCIDCHTLLPLSEEKDYFSLLEVEKRPALNLEVLKENFLKISEVVHPDKFYNASPQAKEIAMGYSSMLNKAYTTLKDPKERLRYLISLETDKDAPVSSRASAETMEFFIEASDLCKEADSHIKKGTGTESEKRGLYKKLEGLKKDSQARWDKVLKDIENVDKEWMASLSENRKTLVRKLLVLSHELSYLSKLQSMINEMIIGLS